MPTKYRIKESIVEGMLESERPEVIAAAQALAGENGCIDLPAHNVVCPRCRGEGTHDHPAFSNGFTRDDEFVDEDFIHEYMSGTYDVTCSVCDGRRVVPEIDNPETLTGHRKVAYDYLMDWHRSEAQHRAEVAAEMRMGA